MKLLKKLQVNYYGKTKYISDAQFDSTGSKYLLLVVNDFQKNREDFYINGSMAENNLCDSDILARIHIANIKHSIGFDDNSDKILKERKYNGVITLEKLEFKLIDEYGLEIDLNNMDYSFALELKCLYN